MELGIYEQLYYEMNKDVMAEYDTALLEHLNNNIYYQMELLAEKKIRLPTPKKDYSIEYKRILELEKRLKEQK